ncbi:MAG: hypothetical protein IPK19_39510 [Chloroflexi bacterium]|nr:hypothetical protein [Chloroflexota bacterium]
MDILVEFTPDAKIDLFDMVRLENELSAIIRHKVDLRTPQDLSRYFRDSVVQSAKLVYERS